MAYLIDSNLLLRSMQPDSVTLFEQANAGVSTLLGRGETMNLVPQCLIEFWAVGTRPKAMNGLGLSISLIEQEVQRLKSLFAVLPETTTIYPLWEQIVVRFAVQGKQVHDARLVAAMQAHSISHLLTFNVPDFVRFAPLDITVVHSASV